MPLVVKGIEGTYLLDCVSKLYFEFIKDFIHVHLICKFQDDLIKTEQVMLMIKYNKGFFINQGDVTQKTNDPIWPGFKLSRFHPCPLYLQVSEGSDQNGTSYADDSPTEAFSATKRT